MKNQLSNQMQQILFLKTEKILNENLETLQHFFYSSFSSKNPLQDVTVKTFFYFHLAFVSTFNVPYLKINGNAVHE